MKWNPGFPNAGREGCRCPCALAGASGLRLLHPGYARSCPRVLWPRESLTCCPITNQIKGYPFEVLIRDNPKVTGAILADQVKHLDWQAR
ncbi:MAG: hypothetical protein ACYCTY_10640 [Sulfuricella sp.]